MGLIVVGISHKTAPVEVREKFSLTKSRLLESQAQFKKMSGIEGAVILSTCNRVEIYVHSSHNEKSLDSIKEFFINRFNIRQEDFRRYFYVLEDNASVRHIFRVASGLDSQVLGELEILGQVKAALLSSRDAGLVNNFLNLVFEKAIDIGASIRRDTKLSYGNVSIGSVAIKLLKDNFKDLQDKKALIIGAGKIASLMSKYLKEERIKGFFVSSRTYGKARQLAEESGGEAVDFDQLPELLKTVSIVISSTSSPHIVLKKKAIEEAMSFRQEPLLLLDLAVPRDVEPAVKEIANVSLLDLDDLKCVIEENYNKRRKEAALAERIIEQEVIRWSSLPVLRVGSRKSPLALRQVEEVVGYLRESGIKTNIEVVGIDTFGDKDKITPISDIEGSDFFTREIEEALLRGDIDFAVHSAKDLPDILPCGLCIAAITPPIDSYDALVSKNKLSLEELPIKARIGVSSSRRKTQLKSYREDFEIVDIRGNIEERLRKFDESELDAIVIAACALKRLGLESRITQRIPFEILKPHPLQGSLAIEVRQDDLELSDLFSKIDTRETVIL